MKLTLENNNLYRSHDYQVATIKGVEFHTAPQLQFNLREPSYFEKLK